MGFLDKVKKGLDNAKDKVDDLAEQHGDKIKGGIDKAADVAGKKLKGKSKQVDSIADKAKGVVDDLAKPDENDTANANATTADAAEGSDATESAAP
jgi:MT0933-like antitoxin protein